MILQNKDALVMSFINRENIVFTVIRLKKIISDWPRKTQNSLNIRLAQFSLPKEARSVARPSLD